MNIYFFSPFSFDKNLFDAYDSHMKLLPNDDDWAVLMDHDVCFLTHDAAMIIRNNIWHHPQVTLFSCLTNRIGCVDQLHEADVSVDPNMFNHLRIAKKLAQDWGGIKIVNTPISGMVMILQKKTWNMVPRMEGILGIDNHISQTVLDNGGTIAILTGLYCWHSYRLDTSIRDKSHLL